MPSDVICMSDYGQVIIPSPTGDDYVELARQRTTKGRLFRKHILTLGALTHPKTGEHLQLGEDFYAHLKDNFNAGVCPIVQVPAGGRAEPSQRGPAAQPG